MAELGPHAKVRDVRAVRVRYVLRPQGWPDITREELWWVIGDDANPSTNYVGE
jgi:hypothetical protein